MFVPSRIDHLRRDVVKGDLGVVPQPPGARVAGVYDRPTPEDGARVLVDRLWPRGLSKVNAALDTWCKEYRPLERAPHLVRTRPRSIRRVCRPLSVRARGPAQAAAFVTLQARCRRETVTLVTTTEALELSHAVVLAAVLSEGT